MDFLFTFHSHFRWLILLSAVVVVVAYLAGILGKREFSRVDRLLGSSFVGLIDVQALLGIILLGHRIATGLLNHHVAEHAVTMILAVVLAHLPARWRQAESGVRFRNSLLCYSGGLTLLAVGILRLRGAFVW